ncbi:mediator complex, subunit Med16 [Myxozyma melibiosi]|uniref:Mediator of RNA polymerase II transcription subunit 16 n=1 Tax=Myxozyma melibiosi TaxID=54550 RepID=A0ABR1FEW4_9ASCO
MNSLIAWSKVGLIVYVPANQPPDSPTKAFSTYLHCVDGQHWSLAPPVAIDDIAIVHEGAAISHLSWCFMGVDLACIDVRGRLSIFVHSSILNHLTCVYQSPPVPDHPGNAVVGFKWCNINKLILINNTATRQDNHEFHYGLHKLNTFGPWHPNSSKQACIAVTKSGELRFWFQQDVKYQEITYDLEPNLRREDYYSLSSFGSDRDDSFVLAVYSKTNHIFKLFRITIQWSIGTVKAGTQPAKPDVDWATIQVKRLYCDELFCPSDNRLELSHLEVVSPANHPESRLNVFAIFSSDSRSTIQKIEVVSLPVTLHSNFDALGFSRNATPEDPSDIVQFKDFHKFDKRLINFSTLYADQVLSLAFADGSIEMRQRNGFSESVPILNSQSIYNLFDAGFGFPPISGAENICMSPNTVAFVALDKAGELKYHQMERIVTGDASEVSLLTAVAIAQRHAISCFSNLCNGDVMSIAVKEASVRDEEFTFALLRQCHRAMGFYLDLPRDVQADKFLVLPALQKLLSFQVSLGLREGWKRTAAGTVAWATLNMRLFAFAITFTLKASSMSKLPGSQLQESDVRAETLVTLLGLTKWCVDHMAYLVQEIYELVLNPEHYLDPATESVALVMLLGGVPRLLIRYTLRGLRGLEQMISRSASRDPDHKSMTRIAFKQLEDIIKTGPVQIASFEKLVNDIETFMRGNSHSDQEERLLLEQRLFFKGRIPVELHPAVHRIRTVFLQRIKPELDIPTLYFYSTEWLGLAEMHKDDTYEMDGLKKQLLLPGKEIKRRCIRCGSVSTIEDLKYVKYASNWTIAFQRNCLCGSAWVRD